MDVYDFQNSFQGTKVVITGGEYSVHLFAYVASYGGRLLATNGNGYRSCLASAAE